MARGVPLNDAINYINSLPFYKLIVPTVDTVRYSYLVNYLVSNNYPVLLVGPVGTGKTSVAQSVLGKLDPAVYNILTVNISAQVYISHYLWLCTLFTSLLHY